MRALLVVAPSPMSVYVVGVRDYYTSACKWADRASGYSNGD